MNSRRFIAMTRKPKEHPEYSRSRPCIAAKEAYTPYCNGENSAGKKTSACWARS